MQKVTLTRAQAEPVVEYLEGELRDRNPGLTFYISGPWRRGAEEIDRIIVVIKSETGSLLDPEGEATVNLPSALEHFDEAEGAWWDSDLRTPYGFIKTTIMLVKPLELGATLWWTTGPDDLWLAMKRTIRERYGWKLTVTGLYTNLLSGERLDDGTEYGIVDRIREKGTEFYALVNPLQRENWKSVLEDLLESTRRIKTIEEVASSDGKRLYEVWIDYEGNAARCECRGFAYRGTCRHLGMAEIIYKRLGARPVEDRVD